VTRKTRYDSDFRSSLAMLNEDAVFAKVAPYGGPFEMAVHDLRHFLDHGVLPEQAETQRWAQGLADRATKPAPRFAKALRDLGTMVKALPATAGRIAGIKVTAPAPTEADLVAKAHANLMFNDRLNAAERGALLLGISAAHDRRFAKAQRSDSHPVAGQIEQIKTALETARDTRDIAGPAAAYLTEALRHIENGIVDADDRSRLMSLLQQLRQALAAVTPMPSARETRNEPFPP
jgi:hypothetical protein